MARRQARVGSTQKLVGYGILALLGVITAWLLVQQARFNPAVLVATRAPELAARPRSAPGQALSATAALFPEVSGFAPLAPIESYGPESLSDKINGKAELYLAAGFKEMSCRSYRLGEVGQAHVEVFLYEMASPPQAYAVFSGQRRPGAAALSLTANAYATENALFFSQGRFYVELVADRAAPGLVAALESYATALLARLPAEGGEAAPAAARLPREGLEADRVRLSPADTFGLEGFNDVLTGEYRLQEGSATAFLAERVTPEQAQTEARSYREFLIVNGYREVKAPEVPSDLTVYSLESASFEVVFVQGRTLAGVHDAASLPAALELAARLQTALKVKP